MATSVSSWTELAAMSLSGDYILIADLSSSDGDYSSAGGDDWDPKGDNTTKFTGTFDGGGYTISNLVVDAGTYNGLFGYVDDATISNLGMINASVTGTGGYCGTLIGRMTGTTSVENCYASGGSASGTTDIGGLIGYIADATTSVDKCYSTASAEGTQSVGGFAGSAIRGTINDCYATGNATEIGAGTGNHFGGFVGQGYSTMTNCYATGNATGGGNVGGFAGIAHTLGAMTNCFATGVAAADDDTPGGLIGHWTVGYSSTNNWWYNATNTVGVGDFADPASVSKASAASDFYVSTQDVYDNTVPYWSFVSSTGLLNTWVEHAATYPTLRGSKIDLTGVDTVAFDVYASRTGSNLKFGLHNKYTLISNADIDDEDMADITDWADGDGGTGDSSQVTFDSKSCMKLDSGASSGGANYSQRSQTFGALPARTVHSFSIYFDAIGPYNRQNYLTHFLDDGTGFFAIRFVTDGVYIQDDSYTWNKISGSDSWVVEDTWQEWTFDINWSTLTADIYLNKTLKVSGITLSTNTVIEGLCRFTQDGSGDANRISYINWFKLGSAFPTGITTELTPNITSANAWQTVTWDLSGVADADKNNIDSFIITVVNADAANTFYVDNFKVVSGWAHKISGVVPAVVNSVPVGNILKINSV